MSEPSKFLLPLTVTVKLEKCWSVVRLRAPMTQGHHVMRHDPCPYRMPSVGVARVCNSDTLEHVINSGLLVPSDDPSGTTLPEGNDRQSDDCLRIA